MRGINDSAAKVGLFAALLILGVVVSTALPPSFLEESAAPPIRTVVPPGYLLVTVAMDGGPLDGVSVAISQFTFHGLHIILATNRSGQVEFPLAPGQYGVSVTDPRFGLETSVPVSSGTTTRLQVTLNRTAFSSVFSAAQDSTLTGEIEPWNQLVVEVAPYGCLTSCGLLGLGGQFGIRVIPSGITLSVPHFGSEVFVQTVRYFANGTGIPTLGSEIPATVISQVAGSGVSWLTLQPLSVLDLSAALYLLVVSYAVGSTVSFSNV